MASAHAGDEACSQALGECETHLSRTRENMAKINVEILGRHLGTAMSSEEKSYQAFTVYDSTQLME